MYEREKAIHFVNKQKNEISEKKQSIKKGSEEKDKERNKQTDNRQKQVTEMARERKIAKTQMK